MLAQFILQKEKFFEIIPKKIFYCTPFNSNIPVNLQNIVTFISGLPSDEICINSERQNILICLDDLMQSAFNSEKIAELFTGGRHRNIQTIILSQNLFFKSTQSRNISLNSSHIIIFYNARDQNGINCLSRQMNASCPQLLSKIFENFINKPYSAVLISYSLADDSILRYRGNILEKGVEVYVTPDQINCLNHEKAVKSIGTFEEVSFCTKSI